MPSVVGINKMFQNVLVTGGAGFIGSHLVRALLAHGLNVTVVDDLSTGNKNNLPDNEKLKLVETSIRDKDTIDQLAKGADIIFHLAAAVGVKQIMENPVHCIETNVEGTQTILKSALAHDCKLVITSTSEIYGKTAAVPFKEDDDAVLGSTSRGRWAYAASKMVSEFLALAYAREKGLKVIIARLFNTVGPRQSGNYGMVIPRFVEQVIGEKRLTIYGDGSQRRCFLHVEDAVEGLLLLALAPDAPGCVYNIGSNEETTILDLSIKIIRLHEKISGGESSGDVPDLNISESEMSRLMDEKLNFIPMDQVYGGGFEDMDRRVPDTERIREATGWKPRHDLDRVLRDIFNEYNIALK